MSKALGYIRVSTIDQNTERQLDGMKFDKVFTDKASGKDTQRPQLAALLDYARDGDSIVVHSIDRFARNTENLLALVRDLTGRGVTVRFVKENLTFSGDASNPMNELMLTMLAGFAQFERALMLERQREGIAIAKAAGKYKGGKARVTEAQAAEMCDRAAKGESKTAIAKEFGISRETLYQYIRTLKSEAQPAE